MAFIYIQYYCVTGKHISYVIMRVCYHHRVHMTPWASLWQEEWAAPMGTYLFLSPPWMPTDRLPKHSNYRWGAYCGHYVCPLHCGDESVTWSVTNCLGYKTISPHQG